jgi:hypothetical protein
MDGETPPPKKLSPPPPAGQSLMVDRLRADRVPPAPAALESFVEGSSNVAAEGLNTAKEALQTAQTTWKVVCAVGATAGVLLLIPGGMLWNQQLNHTASLQDLNTKSAVSASRLAFVDDAFAASCRANDVRFEREQAARLLLEARIRDLEESHRDLERRFVGHNAKSSGQRHRR